MYKKISDYGIIGNLHSTALIGSDGSIDWMCMPRLDSPSIFGALLDDRKGGRFSVRPVGEADSASEYLPGTNVLVTKFRIGSGIMHLTDFMPIPKRGENEIEEAEHELMRCLAVITGNLDAEMVFDPQFDYARVPTSLQWKERYVIARANGKRVVLSCSRPLDKRDGGNVVRWHLSEGDRLWLHLRYGSEEFTEINQEDAQERLEETAGYWRKWLKENETGRQVDCGPYQEMVERSSLVLKLLFYSPTGTFAAAATTSLPEKIGGVRNWDYRYTWVRDTSFTLQALFSLGHLSEIEGYLKWIKNTISEYGAEGLQLLYGVGGERELPEQELEHLEGYKGSRPVRTGNAASDQRQLDIYGEIMDAALMLSNYVGKIDPEMWESLRHICEHVIRHWHEKDNGIWEVRGGSYHFVYSKTMCWVALDRGITIAKRYGFPADTDKWEETASRIKQEIFERGWSEKKNSFVQRYGSEDLDASALLMPILGFLPFDDPRISSTVDAIRRELGHGCFLYRYRFDDGLPGEEGFFLLCTFWLITCLASMGRHEEAERILVEIGAASSPLGLFSEEYDPQWKELLGNFPQAFTHIGYITSVLAFLRTKSGKKEAVFEPGGTHFFIARKMLLNREEPETDIPSAEIVTRMKKAMNILRGAFFDVEKGRVAYERMKGSEAYRNYLVLSRSLKKVDVTTIGGRSDRIALWINLYNVLVIHGVIELGITDSVKEVPNFFRRIQYRIGNMLFTPDDVEHGVLRGNARPPHSVFKPFHDSDERLKCVISPLDPRIHFALVCASSSCPPIEIYTGENLDSELSLSGRTFVNGGGIIIDRGNSTVHLSRIFKWYRNDFGKDQGERLRFISDFLYDAADRDFLRERAKDLTVEYQKYDWRLNKT